MKLGKVWGTTELLLRTPFIEVHRLTIKANARCSMHRHLYKWNAFFVQSGRITIEVEKSDYALVDVTELGAGEFTTVAPGEFHRFRTGKNCAQAIELYYPTELGDDIVRRDVGGLTGRSGVGDQKIKGISRAAKIQTR